MAEFINLRKRKVYGERAVVHANNYKLLHRFTEENVEKMTEIFLDPRVESRGGALTPKKKFEIFLRFVADPGYQIGIAEETGLHRSTICKTIKYVIEKVCEKVPEWIHFPTNDNKIEVAKNKWQENCIFPNAIGAIDCTHIQIKKPVLYGDEYINRKNIPSINVQATCNSSEMFTSVDVKYPGSVHDSRVLKNSDLYQYMNKNNASTYIILGDSGYGVHPKLMTPYKAPRNNAEKYYNKIHTKERVIIERYY